MLDISVSFFHYEFHHETSLSLTFLGRFRSEDEKIWQVSQEKYGPLVKSHFGYGRCLTSPYFNIKKSLRRLASFFWTQHLYSPKILSVKVLVLILGWLREDEPNLHDYLLSFLFKHLMMEFSNITFFLHKISSNRIFDL